MALQIILNKHMYDTSFWIFDTNFWLTPNKRLCFFETWEFSLLNINLLKIFNLIYILFPYPEYHMVSLCEHKCQGRSVELHDRVADDDGPLLQPATGRNYSMFYLHDE